MGRLCACGKPLFTLGKRCPPCQAAYRAARTARTPADKLSPRNARPNPARDPAHLAWIRTHPCIVCRRAGPSEAAHVRDGTGGGTGLKPADVWAVPLCREHHAEQHRLGHRAFDAKHHISLRDQAAQFAKRNNATRKPAF